MRALVTGGAGFIGGHLAGALARQGHHVRVLDDLSSGSHASVPGGIELLEGDVCDAVALTEAMPGADVVFHLAAKISVPWSVEHPVETQQVNAGGTLLVLEACRRAGVRRVVLASSSAVYGDVGVSPMGEDALADPTSPYGLSKLTAEWHARLAWRLHGLETVSLRYFNVFGPGQSPDSDYAAVVPAFLAAVRAGTPLEIHGKGRQTRDFVHVDDVVLANLAAAAAPKERAAGKVFNIGSGHGVTIRELAELVREMTGTDVPVRFTEARPGDVRHSVAWTEAAWRDLGWRATISLPDGLRRCAEALGAGQTRP